MRNIYLIEMWICHSQLLMLCGPGRDRTCDQADKCVVPNRLVLMGETNHFLVEFCSVIVLFRASRSSFLTF